MTIVRVEPVYKGLLRDIFIKVTSEYMFSVLDELQMSYVLKSHLMKLAKNDTATSHNTKCHSIQ